MTDASLLENFSGKEGSSSSGGVFRESRGLDAYSPIVFWIGWIAILYFVVWIVAVYIGPAIFGSSRPFYPHYYGRSLGGPQAPPQRQIQEQNIAQLTAHVLPHLDKKQ